jgi:FkbM family methyltransferase
MYSYYSDVQIHKRLKSPSLFSRHALSFSYMFYPQLFRRQLSLEPKMPSLAGRIAHRAKRIIYSPRLGRFISAPPSPLRRLGTFYGGWHFNRQQVEPGSRAMLCGAGEDISFDLELQKTTGCTVEIIDPTPRAIRHWDQIVDARLRDSSCPINNSASERYDLAGVDFDRVHFVDKAIWTENTTLKFWQPKNPMHVSHSIVNLGGTDDYIEVEALTPQAIADSRGFSLSDVSILKLDIEGAEGPVLKWLLDHGVHVPQVLVEFDEMHHPSAETARRIVEMTQLMLSANYKLVHFDGLSNCVFIRS